MNIADGRYDPSYRRLSSGSAAADLIRRHRYRAIEMAEELSKRPDADIVEVMKWESISEAVRLMARAHLHMDLALQLLDVAGETAAAAHLDLAIERLGLRTPANTLANGASATIPTTGSTPQDIAAQERAPTVVRNLAKRSGDGQ